MTSASRRRTLVTALVVAALSGLAATPAATAVPRSFFGVVPQTALETADLDRMGRGKVGTLRIIINWSLVEADPDVFDWFQVDAIVRDAARNGVKVLPFLYGTPDWVARGLEGNRCSDKCTAFAPRTKSGLAAWREFVAAAVLRYGPNGQFWAENPNLPAKPIRDWQVWNEQNSRDFFRPKPKPKRYAKLLDQTAKVIRGNDRGAEIVLGGMAELANLKPPKAINGSKYLGRLYDRRGVKKDFDAVAPHPYGARLKKVKESVGLYRDEIKKARDRRVDMYVTEIGAGSKSGGNPLNRGKQGQAKLLKQIYRYFKRRRGALNVKTVTWFSWMDSKSSICAWCASSGLFKQGRVEKPSWRAFVKFTGGS